MEFCLHGPEGRKKNVNRQEKKQKIDTHTHSLNITVVAVQSRKRSLRIAKIRRFNLFSGLTQGLISESELANHKCAKDLIYAHIQQGSVDHNMYRNLIKFRNMYRNVSAIQFRHAYRIFNCGARVGRTNQEKKMASQKISTNSS